MRGCTQNYCCVVSEFVLHYTAPEGTKAWRLNDFPHSDTIHVFLEWPDGAIVDLTADQFGGTVIPYHEKEPHQHNYHTTYNSLVAVRNLHTTTYNGLVAVRNLHTTYNGLIVFQT
eukprot:COSAG01_NODE_6315_length_3741_cov_10.035969_3_plen_115_part_00